MRADYHERRGIGGGDHSVGFTLTNSDRGD